VTVNIAGQESLRETLSYHIDDDSLVLRLWEFTAWSHTYLFLSHFHWILITIKID